MMSLQRRDVHRTLPQLLSDNADTTPHGIFVETDDVRVTWSEMLLRATRVRAGLERIGVAFGDNVVLALGNRLEFFDAWFGLAMLGAVEVPINPDLVGDRLVHILNHSMCRVAIVEPDTAKELEAVRDRLTTLEQLVIVGCRESPFFRSLSLDDLSIEPGPFAAPELTRKDLAAMLYTSGSTGPPKGVMVPYGQHYTNGSQAVLVADIRRNDTIFVCLPLHHNMAQGYGIWPALISGCSIRLAKFDRHSFWGTVRQSNATVWPFVGGLLALLNEQPQARDDSSNPLRVAYGVPIPGALHKEFERRFDIVLIHGYGSTEATIPVWSNQDGCPPGAAGRVSSGFDVTVLDAWDHTVPAGSVGEICVRPKHPFTMFQGYYRNPEKTVDAWRNLWFHTSDRGLFDEDGYLWFRGRMGDVIRRFGEFVDAEDVEGAAMSHPDVVQAAAVGVDDAVAGEEILLCVVVRGGSTATTQEIRSWVSDRVPRYAFPRYVEIVSEFPLTPTGKVERYKLKMRGISAEADDSRVKKGSIH